MSEVRAVAPWVRTRLRAAPLPALALTVLVLVTSFLAAAFPRAVEAYEGEGLRHEMEIAPPELSGFRFTDIPEDFGGTDTAERAASLSPDTLAARYRKIVAALPRPLRADPGQSVHGVRTPAPVDSLDPWLTQLDGGAPVFTLSTRSGLAEHTTVRSGRLPRGRATEPDAASVEGVVTSATAEALNIRLGSTVRVPRAGASAPLVVRITGIVEPVRPAGGYWSVEPVLGTPVRLYTAPPSPQPYWHGALLLPPQAAPALLSVATDSEAYWRIALDAGGLRVGDVPRVRKAVASLENGPARTALRTSVAPGLDIESGLDDILADVEGVFASIGPVVSVAAFGAGGVMVVVLLMSGGLAAARRHTELALLRSRGGSVPGIAGRLLAESAVPVVPAAVAGCAAAFLLVPEGRPLPPVLASAAVALIACAALPLRAVFLAFVHRRPRLHGERDDVVRARPSRRRAVAELTVLVLAVAAVAALRRRGTSDGGDQLISAAPILVGGVAALALVRIHPLPLRIAARVTARRRGAVGFLSLARAGRSPATAALPLLALLLALTTAAFGGSVLTGVADARDRAALITVGADARVEAAEQLPEGLAGMVRALDGVRDVAVVHRDWDLDLRDSGRGTDSVALLAVEPDAYARLARGTGTGGFRADELRGPAAGPLPAIASPAVAERLGEREAVIGPPSALFTVRVTAVRKTTPALEGGEFLIVDASRVPGGRAANILLITGSGVAAGDLGAAVREADASGTAVRLRSAERDAFTESPVQSGAERVYAVATVTGAGYAVLALLLSLLRSAPERVALLARLRTMGLTRRQGRRLLVLESLPQTLLAAVGGVLAGWAAILLLSPGIDLDRLALAARRLSSPVPVRLTADPWSLLLPAFAVVVIAAGVAAAQAWVTTRRTSTTELRAGDTR
ncbi:FtsX-like permease family protein [Streptomyces sp. NPDC051018]|uniref:FtsX-like permease family protein n=1 Tax=Streptomyces sp. NPDC051018 TaxID=3365639 RepID=UPI0037B93814